MAFENVNPSSLRNAINSCLNNLHNEFSKSLSSSLTPSVWQGDCKKQLESAIDSLNNKRYKELKELLEKYRDIPNYIEEYQKLQKQNETYRSEIGNLNANLYYNVEEYESRVDAYGRTYSAFKGYRQEVNDGVRRQIDDRNNSIGNNSKRMMELENMVNQKI